MDNSTFPFMLKERNLSGDIVYNLLFTSAKTNGLKIKIQTFKCILTNSYYSSYRFQKKEYVRRKFVVFILRHKITSNST